MKKVTLYHKEENKMYDIILSVEDANRALSDTVFATSLLNASIRDRIDNNIQFQNINGEVIENVNDEVSQNVNDEVTQASTNNDLPSDSEEGSLYRWSEPCVLLLLRTYQEMESKFNDGKNSHKKCWQQVSKHLKDQGYNVTGTQCASKLRSLKKTYKSIKEHNSKSGNDRRTWQYFEIMEEIFSKKAWCNPVAVASSTGLSVKNTNVESSPSSSKASCSYDDEGKENSSDSYSEVKSPTTRMSIPRLLQKRLAQKEDHEQKKQKRHEERIAIEKQLIGALSEYLKK